MPTLSLTFEVFCTCGAGLCNNATEGENRHSQHITIEPCKVCLDGARDEGYDEGHDEGYNECKQDNDL